ncbi:MAG: iron hydrogenase small subunit [Syntrophomonadaceae bacterium]|jgi:hypothetical protein
MSTFTEKEGITRRQFFKGAGMIVVTAVLGGIFAKIGIDMFKASTAYIEERISGLYTLDEKMALRKSHENPEILKLYQDFLSPGDVKPLSEKAHHLLHTKYGNDIPGLIAELHKHQHTAA